LDHVGSVNYIIEDFAIEEIVINQFYELDEKTRQLWEKFNIEITFVSFNEMLERRGQLFQVVSPEENRQTDNENSLVLYTELGGKSWLFTGDIGKETEVKIKQNYPSLNVDMLKVGHHGSNTSTDSIFIKEVRPEVALISAGVNNRYGHPTDEVIETLAKNDVIIYRTDVQGAVQYTFNKTQAEFSTFLQSQYKNKNAAKR